LNDDAHAGWHVARGPEGAPHETEQVVLAA
jgi:hypothetical protein